MLEPLPPDVPLDADEYRKQLAEFEELAAGGASIELLSEQYSILAGFTRLRTPVLRKNSRLYRAVRGRKKPAFVREISYPPKHCVHYPGRLNEANSVMFYASLAPTPCLFECDFRPGQVFALSEWDTTTDLALNHLGYSRSAFVKAGSSREQIHDWATPENEDERTAIFRGWQSGLFTRTVPEGSEYLYNVTIAMAKLALRPIKTPEGIGHFAGVLYPSIAMWMNEDNVALLPEYVDSFLRLIRVRFMYVSWRKDPDGRAETLDTATNFTEDGRIIWNGENTYFSVSPWP